MEHISHKYVYVNEHFILLERSNKLEYSSEDEGDHMGDGVTLKEAIEIAEWIVEGHPDEYPYGIKISEEAVMREERLRILMAP